MKTQKNVTLRGFEESEKANATKLLTEAGYTVVNTVTACDIVAVGSLGWQADGKLSQDRATAVLPFADLLRVIRPASAEARPSKGRHPIVERLDEHQVRVLGIDIQLPRVPSMGGIVPGPERFDRICLDRCFLRAARAVALGIAHGFPTALEGATAASKTTVVLFLAHLLRQPVLRMNLNGQTDTSELIGRYVPATGRDPSWDLAGLARLERFLKPASRELVQQAVGEGRALDWAEASLLAAAEGLHAARWRFQEGVIPTALRHGAWVLLDEINLGEPQILERLNPVLELPPTLHLSECDGTTFGRGGDVPVHEGFRIFSTMNPSEYAGRQKLSPAFADRWLNWFHAETPTEAEYLAQLRLLVFGNHPEVVLDGCIYQGTAVEPVASSLRGVASIDYMLSALASCQASLASGAAGRRRDATPFTRRSLNALVELWDRRVSESGTDARAALQASLQDLYFARIGDAAECKAAKGVAEAAGLPVDK